MILLIQRLFPNISVKADFNPIVLAQRYFLSPACVESVVNILWHTYRIQTSGSDVCTTIWSLALIDLYLIHLCT